MNTLKYILLFVTLTPRPSFDTKYSSVSIFKIYYLSTEHIYILSFHPKIRLLGRLQV